MRKYAIIDIETTGGKASRDRITEIAIVIHDGAKVLDTFETLINPRTSIPYGIVQLTGITDEMVKDAPEFHEVARRIVEMTEGCIFVAHNVRFDYSFIVESFKRLGYTYTRKTLCTVRLSRKAFPGLPSYSLGKLIKHFGIKVKDRHRAMADTMATVELLQMIFEGKSNETDIKEMVNLGMKESLLPKNLNVEKIHDLPEAVGVYYFHDVLGDVVYVGKSINIKKRVAQHFSKKTAKAATLQKLVHDISYEITGSELVSLLYESHEIKRLKPMVNRAQRQVQFPYILHKYENEAGYICFDVVKASAKAKSEYDIVAEYPKQGAARGRLNMILEQHELCSKYLNIERGDGPCFKYHLKSCHGACVAQEPVAEYNERAALAVEQLATTLETDCIIIDKGPSPTEKSIVVVENGEYLGFGYADESEFQGGIEDLKSSIKRYDSNPETKRIIRRFLLDEHDMKVITL